MFEAVLIANRGEIARRVTRTLARLGIRSIAVYTPADRGAPHVRDADAAVAIAAYLDLEAVIDACRRSGATALHPGYGFLSESPALARACTAAGVTFVGPPPDALELMGDKLRAKEVARAAGVPVVPGFTEAEAPSARYPLLVKAAAGGGGRGMRVVRHPSELDAALASARREAQAGFGDDRVFIERFLPRARHLEVQVIADAHGHVLHLGERECSLQRRHQKVIEESPSPVVDDALRATLGAEAVALMRAGGYVNAGTVEFVADAENPEEHFFLECNARLQVEHPVTELVYGLDLVELQLRVAAGEPLALRQEDVRISGHAIEARVCAEDAARDFLPSIGRVLAYARPQTAHARVDDGIEAGSVIDTSYDSLLAKVIVHADDRRAALAGLDRALARMSVLGVSTTTGFLRTLLAREDVRAGDLDTGLLERLPAWAPPFGEAQVAQACASMLMARAARAAGDDPFERADGWRLGGGRAGSWWRLAVGSGEPQDVHVPAKVEAEPIAGVPADADADAEPIAGVPAAAEPIAGVPADTEPTADGRYAVTIDGERREWTLAQDQHALWVGCEGFAWPVAPVSAAHARRARSDGTVRAPMPGQVLAVWAAVGDHVSAGDPLLVLESMKMELALTAPVDGALAELTVAVGDRVLVDQPLARVEAAIP